MPVQESAQSPTANTVAHNVPHSPTSVLGKDNDTPGRRSRFMIVLSGLLMGGADAIPGVSGGTIALILGIYHRFIESLHQLLRAPFAILPSGNDRSTQRKKLSAALGFLLPLGLGVAIAYYFVTKLVVGKSENPGLMIRPATAAICYGFFFGLVLLSLSEPWRRIKNVGVAQIAALILGCVAAAVFCGLPHSTLEPTSLLLLFGGAGAISVMVMPGVSGSLLLVILGLYQPIINAIHDRNLRVIAIFGIGIVGGIAIFIPFLRHLLRRHHDVTMAWLTGMMAGSLRALWPWKDGYDTKASQMNNIGIGDNLPQVIAAMLCGGAIVLVLAKLERKLASSGKHE